MTQYDQVSTAAGYASSSAGPIHFGLGKDTGADLIEIRWPSGTIQTLRDVRGGRIVRVKEPSK
jgi:enediyne biosynthesis protein E4